MDPQSDNLKNVARFRLPEMDQQEWYSDVYDLAPSLCMVLNAEGVIIDCNLALVRAIGYSVRGEVNGRSVFEFTDHESEDTLRKSFEVWRRTGKVHNHEFKMKRADGSTFPVLMNATSIHDELGRIIACNAVIINITELVNARKKAEVAMNEVIQKEKELQETNEELKRVERAKEEFVSMVSHELKNPLSPILAFSGLLKKQAISGEPWKEQHLASIAVINQNAKDMKRLIEDILMVYKLDMRLKFSFSETNIVKLVEEVIVELFSMLEDKGIKVERKISLAEGQESIVACDPLRIRQVLINLIRNAVDFLPISNGKIIVSLEKTEELIPRQGVGGIVTSPGVLFSIVDNGPGIPADKISGLFKKFYQANPGVNRKHGGTGLGLTICKEIVEMHGGRIWYDSEYVNGACFRFVIPKVPPAA